MIRKPALSIVVTLVGTVLLFRPFLALSFNEQKAQLLGLRPRLAHVALLGLITIAIVGSQVEHGGVPGFVFAIFVSLFVFFNSFAINQLLQYRRVGPWRDYRFGEAVYVGLSLVAKSALAWQVFANTLVPT